MHHIHDSPGEKMPLSGLERRGSHGGYGLYQQVRASIFKQRGVSITTKGKLIFLSRKSLHRRALRPQGIGSEALTSRSTLVSIVAFSYNDPCSQADLFYKHALPVMGTSGQCSGHM